MDVFLGHLNSCAELRHRGQWRLVLEFACLGTCKLCLDRRGRCVTRNLLLGTQRVLSCVLGLLVFGIYGSAVPPKDFQYLAPLNTFAGNWYVRRLVGMYAWRKWSYYTACINTLPWVQLETKWRSIMEGSLSSRNGQGQQSDVCRHRTDVSLRAGFRRHPYPEQEAGQSRPEHSGSAGLPLPAGLASHLSQARCCFPGRSNHGSEQQGLSTFLVVGQRVEYFNHCSCFGCHP